MASRSPSNGIRLCQCPACIRKSLALTPRLTQPTPTTQTKIPISSTRPTSSIKLTPTIKSISTTKPTSSTRPTCPCPSSCPFHDITPEKSATPKESREKQLEREVERLQRVVETQRKLNEEKDEGIQKISEKIDQITTQMMSLPRNSGCGGSRRYRGDAPSCDWGGDGGDCC